MPTSRCRVAIETGGAIKAKAEGINAHSLPYVYRICTYARCYRSGGRAEMSSRKARSSSWMLSSLP